MYVWSDFWTKKRLIQTENFEREKNFKEDFLLTRPCELSSHKFFIGRANKKIVFGTTQQISCSVTFKYFFCVDLKPIEQVLKGVDHWCFTQGKFCKTFT